MANYFLTFPSTLNGENGMNQSVQVGDIVYHMVPQNQQGGKNHPNATGDTRPKKFGDVIGVAMSNSTIMVNNNYCSSCNPLVGPTPYFMFSKNRQANTSGITGYYAETEYRNHSTLPAEIFATAVDYVESSK